MKTELVSTPVDTASAAADAGNATSWSCWLWTTTGIVLMLLLIQFVTGLLLAFYFVPSIDHAHATVSFIEKVLPAGSWIRALHHHGSQWLPLFLFLHIGELFLRSAYKTRKARWVAAVVLWGLLLVAGATGYSLPWDARAFFSTRVAEGIMNGLPVIGGVARTWLLGSKEISTLTLSRFFALHVLVIPFLILLVVAWQYYVHEIRQRWGTTEDRFRSKERSHAFGSNQLTRNVIVATGVFLMLAIYSFKFPAPLGPTVGDATAGYLPRPGLQFIWLFQTLKYAPGSLGSLIGVLLPGLILMTLAALPWLNRTPLRRIAQDSQRTIGKAILLLSVVFIVVMTLLSYADDRRDPRTRQQLARQAADEAAFRQKPFVPGVINDGNAVDSLDSVASSTASLGNPPTAFTKLCASCHGEHGEGARQGPLKFPPLLGVAEKPHRSVDEIISLLNDPKAYGLEPPMKSFATKLTDDEKREIATWVVTLKKP
jgi:ubiquinol-cytochrome c reductase cytochrome b subunit